MQDFQLYYFNFNRQIGIKEDRAFSRHSGSAPRPIKKARRSSDDEDNVIIPVEIKKEIKEEVVEPIEPVPIENQSQRLPSIATLTAHKEKKMILGPLPGSKQWQQNNFQNVENVPLGHHPVMNGGHYDVTHNQENLMNGHRIPHNGHPMEHMPIPPAHQPHLPNHCDNMHVNWNNNVMSYDLNAHHMGNHLNHHMLVANNHYDLPPTIDVRMEGQEFVELSPLTPVPFNALQPVKQEQEYTTDGYNTIHVEEEKDTRELTLSEQTDKWISALALVELAHGMYILVNFIFYFGV